MALGKIDLKGALIITAGGAVSDSGVIDVDAGVTISAADQTVVLDSAGNDLGGLVIVPAAKSVILRNIDSVSLGSVQASGSLTVQARNSIRLQERPSTPSLTLESSGSIVFEFSRELVSENTVLRAAQSLGSLHDPLLLQGSTLTLRSDRGEIHAGLSGSEDPLLTVEAAGTVVLQRMGDLGFAAGSLVKSGATVLIRASKDLSVSGLALEAPSTRLEAGGRIRSAAVENPPTLNFTGSLHLQAQSGVGGFDFERILVGAPSSGMPLSVRNGSAGDVVIAGLDGLTLSPESVRTDSGGWVVLLGGSGRIVEQGDALKGTQVVRALGTHWISRSGAEALRLLSASQSSANDATQKTTISPALADLIARHSAQSNADSPLTRINQLLSRSFAELGRSAEALDTSAQLLSTQSESIIRVTYGFDEGAGLVGMAGPRSTTQLLAAAMSLTQQGRGPDLEPSEGIGSWAVRTAPGSDFRSSPAEAPGGPPAGQDAQPEPVEGAGRPADQRGSDSPAEPRPASGGDGRDEPNDRTPQTSPQNSPAETISDVRWLLPEEDLREWMPLTSKSSPPLPAASGLVEGMKHAAAKIGQWLGLGG